MNMFHCVCVCEGGRAGVGAMLEKNYDKAT